jgi:hypothetical protein
LNAVDGHASILNDTQQDADTEDFKRMQEGYMCYYFEASEIRRRELEDLKLNLLVQQAIAFKSKYF